MLGALRKLRGGVSFVWEDDGATLRVDASDDAHWLVPAAEIDVGNAGTAARFLTTICTLAVVEGVDRAVSGTVLTGNRRMQARPIGPLVDALRSNGPRLQRPLDPAAGTHTHALVRAPTAPATTAAATGCDIEYLGETGCLPLRIHPTGLHGGSIQLAAALSSQYASSVLMAAPLAHSPVVLELVGPSVASEPYIDMTVRMMQGPTWRQRVFPCSARGGRTHGPGRTLLRRGPNGGRTAAFGASVAPVAGSVPTYAVAALPYHDSPAVGRNKRGRGGRPVPLIEGVAAYRNRADVGLCRRGGCVICDVGVGHRSHHGWHRHGRRRRSGQLARRRQVLSG